MPRLYPDTLTNLLGLLYNQKSYTIEATSVSIMTSKSLHLEPSSSMECKELSKHYEMVYVLPLYVRFHVRLRNLVLHLQVNLQLRLMRLFWEILHLLSPLRCRRPMSLRSRESYPYPMSELRNTGCCIIQDNRLRLY